MIKIKKQLTNIFVFFIAIISIFSFLIFGKENLLIGIGSISIAITMIGQNYKSNKIQTFITLSVIQLILGLGAYISGYSSIIATFVSLSISFSIYYIFSNETKASKSSAFMTLYVLLLYSPITIEQLPKRLIALIFSSLVIMCLYFILSRYNFKKITNSQIINTIDLINKQLDLIKEGQVIEEFNKNASILLKNIELNIYDSIEKNKKLSIEVYKKEVVVLLLKKINTSLNYIKESEIDETLFKNLKFVLDDIKLYILEKISDNELKERFIKYDSNYDIKSLNSDLKTYNYYNLRLAIKELYRQLDNEFIIQNLREKISLRLQLKTDIDILKNNFSMSSLRFNIAVKASILIATSIFIVNYFNIYEGKWIVLTLSILLLPYAEQSSKKALDRVIGTVIGAIIFGLIYKFIDGNIILITIVFLISLYMNISVRKYDIRCIFITINAIMAVKMIYPSSVVFKLIEYRIVLILIAALLTWIIVNLIFPYKIKNDIANIIKHYIKFDNYIISLSTSEGIEYEEIEKINIKNNYLWSRVNFINKQLKNDDIEEFLKRQNDFFTNISLSILLGGGVDKQLRLIKKLKREAKSQIKSKSLYDSYKKIFSKSNDDLEKAIIISFYRIYMDIKDISLLGENIIKKYIN
ncbi:membrane protein [[Clostridium] sordellii]|uniref:Fusaric acid resistance-like family protein n=1 Tax=Paraclostridium sordellii TaxID=1505 RepID=A0ABM9RSU1_PARSO|nr:FUSC family protein [Paeniclostridium sordellii]CEJ75118.1 fusaric acid resistance-like family protein [[Clostridium] sordellii] [Paeniclostridium sordellii]CEN70887.1 membrane protein [[Clostridium] sordellii] [Paeniclostridium sordellii]CEN74178.1 membrane protein [[Clostridium] sordellii] [Paeniclostridium sordellii]CEO30201.1 membrane protein [[Clostridium] sordellii] [Paeniclostridium sordellii]CEP65758.1 membrane protein [[Clostridium] sordellii] [Paeniclostridium sordellii]